MKKILSFTIILFGLFFCVGCTSVQMITINVQKPAQITLPRQVNNIAIVNNAIPQPPFQGHIEYKYTKKGERYNEEFIVENDSICSFMTEVLFENMVDLDYFENVSLYEYPLRDDLSYLEERPIDSITVKELCSAMNADALVSLDRFIASSVKHGEPYNIDLEHRFLDLKMEANFHIYSKNGQLISPPIYMRDSIYWEDIYSPAKKSILSEDSIPTHKEALEQTAGYIAEKIAKAFVPVWEEEPRLVFGDNKEAGKKAISNDWDGAMTLWKTDFEKEQKIKKKARLASNIALGYELSDNITEALKWAGTAVELFSQSLETNIDRNYFEMAKDYQEELIKRHQDFRILDIRDK